MDYINGRLTDIGSINEVQQDIEELKAGKQDKLVDGVTIKKLNNQSVLGVGNIDITEAKLQSSLTTTVAVGNIPVGTTFPQGTAIETILRQLFNAN